MTRSGRVPGDGPYNDGMSSLVLSVPDISCAHCKAAIESAVGEVSGVAGVQVDIEAKTVSVEGAPSTDAVVAAIADAGYDVADPA